MTFSQTFMKGIHLDLKVHTPNLTAMKEQIRDAAQWGFNTVLLEYQEHFPYTGDLEAIAEDAMDPQELDELLSYCDALSMEVIPVLQCIGHMHYVLRHDSFACAAEDPGAFDAPHALCPSNPDSLLLFEKMLRQVAAKHPHVRYFHIGGDETRLSPNCPRCAPAGMVQALKKRYLDCCTLVQEMGYTPILWADMLLTHPEMLDDFAGKAALMDWNYFATDRTLQRPLLWGIDASHPEGWPAAHQFIRPHAYWSEPLLPRPFPYLQPLKERGFTVFAACAARCSGDAVFAPQAFHRDNCRQAVYSAAQSHADGVVVTSWSVRRCPWMSTENSLMAAAMTMEQLDCTTEAVDRCFARESFGTDDERLAWIPQILGLEASRASRTIDWYTAGLAYPQQDTGYVESYEERLRYCGQPLLLPEITAAYERLAHSAHLCSQLLNTANPKTERQEQRVQLWRWAIEWAKFFAGYVPAACGAGEPEWDQWTQRLLSLRQQNECLLKSRLTAAAFANDDDARVGLHLREIERMKKESLR